MFSIEVVETNNNINDMAGIVSDRPIRLTGTAKKYPEDLRMVMFHDAVNDEAISFSNRLLKIKMAMNSN